MARESRDGRSVVVSLLLSCLLLLVCINGAEARALRELQTKTNPLLNALYKLNIIRTVEPAHLPPPTGDGDAASLAAGDSNTPFCVNPPDAPPSSSTPPLTSTPSTSTPSIPDQPPPLPPITPVPPSFEPSPPEGSTPGGGQGGGQGSTPGGGQGGDQGSTPGGGQGSPPAFTTPSPPQLGPSTPAGTAPPSPIVVVPSPGEPGSGSGSGSGPGSGSGGSGGPFQPPIVYPPPLAPPQQPGAGQPLWCVAKPTVPDPIIQEAMDYACGSGAECGAIQPSGACYQPDTVLAHASFAFNSYWQQTRAAGGTCDFGGTATIVTRDPKVQIRPYIGKRKNENADEHINHHESQAIVTYQRRQTGRVGGSFRLSTGGAGSVQAALLAASTSTRELVFQPTVGSDFDSAEEAYEFYNLYSWELGFGIRYGRSSVNSKGYKTRQDIVCACYGTDHRPNRATIRTNCPAMIRLHRTEDDGWFISRFNVHHNHEMSIGCAEKRQWRSHNKIDPITRDLIKNLRMNNVSMSKVWSILSYTHGSAYTTPFRKQDVRTVCAAIARESIYGDMQKTLNLFRSMRENDKSFVYEVDVDKMGQLRSIFWCNGQSQMLYNSFGDAVTFDTTYRTNLYNMPFGIFVGVNNHFQSVIFGGVFFREETVDAFSWAFSTFVKTMGGRLPRTFLTDQCHQMAVALRQELPLVAHRWCKWHVLRKAKENIGHAYTKHVSFKREFHEFLSQMMSVKEFETRWVEMMVRYNLINNKYLQRAFHYRHMWAKPYFANIFCAGMTSTQRSESANHMLKKYVPRSSAMHHFVSQFDKLLADRHCEQAREEHCTNKVARKMRFGFAIERHAAEIYTRTIFNKFSDEMFASGSLLIAKQADEKTYIVLDPHIVTTTNTCVVHMDHENQFCRCSCGEFEHSGMLCKHMLKVMIHLGLEKIPSQCISLRWTRSWGPKLLLDQMFGNMENLNEHSSLHNAIHISAINLVNQAGGTIDGYKIVAKHLGAAINEMETSSSDIHRSKLNRMHVSSDGSVFSGPIKIRSKGRPAHKRLKYAAEKYKSKSVLRK
ncbi:hypothetical protein ACP70R_010970 [Stipagrostis hirtigluma subsp. patula]